MSWERRGECNHCGYCCIFGVQKVTIRMPRGLPKETEFLRIRGFKWTKDKGWEGMQASGEIFLPCPYHVRGRCGIYETRPEVCKDFPARPEQVVGTPCSYWFEDTDGKEAPIGGDASPYGQQHAAFERVKEWAEPKQE